MCLRKTGTYIPLCGDLRFDADPMPNPEEIANAQYFTKIDLLKGFWQVPRSKSTKEKTAIKTPMEIFQFRYTGNWRNLGIAPLLIVGRIM